MANVKYTADDFLRIAGETGTLDQFSEFDLKNAYADPEFGISMAYLKRDYAKAATDDARALINYEAEKLRTKSGYTAGADGSGYYKTNSPGAFERGEKAPEYESAYKDTQRQLTGQMLDYGAFSYDQDTDESYKAARRQYLREGDRAAKNAIARASANTGGLPSTYAVTAATQAGDYYASQLDDAYNQYYQQAYNRWKDQYGRLNNNLNAVTSLEQDDYQKHLNDYGKYTDDRDFAYQQYINDRNYDYTADSQADANASANRQQQFANALALYNSTGYMNDYLRSLLK